jgi:diacylglycerol kinase family enzyme
MTMEWVGIAANAHSGRGQGRRRVEHLVRCLEGMGLDARIAWTPEGRAEMVAESHDDASCRCLVAAGGDGTVASLINERPSRPITVLPVGTENLFARHFLMRRRPEDLAETIALGRVATIDLGLNAGRRFALMAGIGFDADVVTRHHAARVGLAGRMRPTSRSAYVEPVLRASFGYKFPSLRILADGPCGEEELVGTTAFIFNLPRYALGLPIAPTALGDDGMLDLVVFRDAGPLRALHYLWMVFRGLHLRRDGVAHRRVARVSVASSECVPVQLDGDPGGVVHAEGPCAPWTVEVLPAAVSVMVPPRYARDIAIA